MSLILQNLQEMHPTRILLQVKLIRECFRSQVRAVLVKKSKRVPVPIVPIEIAFQIKLSTVIWTVSFAIICLGNTTVFRYFSKLLTCSTFFCYNREARSESGRNPTAFSGISTAKFISKSASVSNGFKQELPPVDECLFIFKCFNVIPIC